VTVKVANCRDGRRLYFETDHYFAPLLEAYGEYSPGEAEVFRQMIREGDTVVDAGAHVGCHTVTLAKLVGPRGAVYAFEPQRPVFYALCGSLALNEAWNVHAFQCALGTARGMTKMPLLDYSERNNFGGISVGTDDGADVPVMALDDFDLPQLRFLKIDVEGHETEMLAGAGQTIRRCRPIIYVENDRRENSDQLIATLADLGYDMYLHTPPLHSGQKYMPMLGDRAGPTVVSFMLLCVPTEQGSKIEGLKRVAGSGDMPAIAV
jgi:FkbM family methyltransferase